jgi:hypothetical protein
MTQDMFIQGRNITAGELDLIRDLMAQNPLSPPPTEAQKKRGRRKKSKARKNAVGAMDALTRLLQSSIPRNNKLGEIIAQSASLQYSNTPILQNLPLCPCSLLVLPALYLSSYILSCFY